MKIRTPFNVIGDFVIAVAKELAGVSEAPKKEESKEEWDNAAEVHMHCVHAGDNVVKLQWDNNQKWITGICWGCNKSYSIRTADLKKLGKQNSKAFGSGHIYYSLSYRSIE